MSYKRFQIFIVLFFAVSQISCSPNLFDEASNKTTDEYYFEEAERANNQTAYDTAIEYIQKMSASYQARSQTKELLASAYAGKCGLNFLNYAESLKTTTGTSAFSIMMAPMIGIASDPSFCLLALQTMDSIGTKAQRTTSQNTFTAVVGAVMIGSALRNEVDASPAATYGNGINEKTSCFGDASVSSINNTIVGFGYLAENIDALPSSLIGGSASTLNDMVTKCVALVGAAGCSVKTTAAVTKSTRNFYRDVLNTSEYGVGNISAGANDVNLLNACGTDEP